MIPIPAFDDDDILEDELQDDIDQDEDKDMTDYEFHKWANPSMCSQNFKWRGR